MMGTTTASVARANKTTPIRSIRYRLDVAA